MINRPISRRDFVKATTAIAGTAVIGSKINLSAAEQKRTATDIVTLGKTGLKPTRLGFGTGSNSGNVQYELGKEEFINLIHYAYDKGIRYFDCAQSYRTFGWIGDAIKGLPREKLFLLSKVPGKPEDVLKVIDNHRKTFNTDYIDVLLIHCMTKNNWTDEYKRIMDAFDEAKEKKWILAKGCSCHSLPALQTAVASPWTEVHLVRINPQARHIDGPDESWNRPGNKIEPVIEEIKKMSAKGRGILGMKIIGNGEFTNAEDREKSIRFAMSLKEVHAVTIGFKSRAEIDEAIERINRALAS
ncbi:MAG TPA: aldo/keto reductase [Verrucomicrobiota bacterium]|nr:aldo/keto reductase [Verrucomicrobiota bacterium]